MCRGCCCGTTRKHPDVDHDGIAEILENTIGPHAELRRVECLWACELSNVVVVNPAAQARRQGARPAWFTRVNTLERARDIALWVRQGGPGIADPSEELGVVLTAAELRRVSPPGW
jgi:(2Fe-2S) ferredoxin